jgi:glycerol-3-phosphate dehydrogenase
MAAGLVFNHRLTVDRNRRLPPHTIIRAGGLMGSRRLAKAAPGLMTGSKAPAAFWDDAIVVDPDRVLTELLWAARSAGAFVSNHAEVVEYLTTADSVRGVAICDRITGEQLELHGDVVIDCTSGWLARQDRWAEAFRRRSRVAYLKAVNLVVDCAPPEYGIGAWSRRGRYLFAVPSTGRTTIGTWYLPLEDGPDSPTVSASEMSEMLTEIADTFPTHPDLSGRVTCRQIGVLPCDADDVGAPDPQPISAHRILRGEEFGGPSGLWMAQGEKWTTARLAAEMIVSDIGRRHGLPVERSSSAELTLLDGDTRDNSNTKGAISTVARERLVVRRGSAGLEMVGRSTNSDQAAMPLPGRADVIRAEVEHALKNELVCTLADLLRRLGIGQLAMPDTITLRALADEVRAKDWSDAEVERQLEEFRQQPKWG